MTIVIDTPEGIAAFAALQRYYALKLEVKTGMRHSRGSILNLIKGETGLTGNKKRVLREYGAMLVEAGILSAEAYDRDNTPDASA